MRGVLSVKRALTFFKTLRHSEERTQLVISVIEAASTEASELVILAATQLR